MITPKRRRGRLFTELFYLSFLALLILYTFNARVVAAPKTKEKTKPYALIAGTVWGPDDRPVYGVTVKIRRATDKAKKARWVVQSDHMGEFAQRIPAGEADYILWADLKGFKPADGKPVHLVQQVTIHIYNDEREDTGLHLAH